MGIELFKIVSPVDLSYDNATGPITISPPLNTEVTVASVTERVEAGDELKIDYALNLIATTTSNWSVTFQLRLYRHGELINTKNYSRNGQQAGTQAVPTASTYVDTAPESLAAATYVLRAIVTAATNATVATGTSINMNIITFN